MKKNTLIFLIILIVFVWVLPGYRASMEIIVIHGKFLHFVLLRIWEVLYE